MSSDELHESAKGEAASSGTEAAPGGPSIVVLGDRDHVEKRPAIYLGPGAVTSVTAPVVGRGGRLEFREVQKVPRLHNAAKEIFVNASDQVFRESGAGENKTKAIRINLNKETGEIVVRNNGSGIPIRQMDVKTGADHPSTVMWEPTVVFSVWRSSSNYDDTKDRTTAGQNGLGAKLTNTVSKKFDVETVDDTTKRRFRQSWSRNMKETTGPVVEENVTAEPYTQVAFVLDFHNYDTESADAEQLDADQLEEDRLGLLKMLAYETALVVAGKCQVYLNDELLPISDLKSFVDLFEQPKLDTPGLKYPRPVCYEVLSQDWEIAALAGDGASFKQQSFVNAINTVDGGTHVDYIKKQVVDALAKKLKITTFAEKKILTNQLWLFVKYRRDKPEFGTQVKDQLTKPSVKQIAREQAVCIPDSFINSILKSGVAEMFRAAAKERQHNKMDQQFKSTKGHKRILGLPKLEDANHAGHGEKSQGCTLILTEGDSAKALAVAGLGVVGRDKYGVFPLRGKVLNVRDCSDALFHGNKEIQAICRIVGLQPHVPNPKKKDLRYQRIMIMTDQDLDGSHIKGLLVNLFFSKWPSLVKDNDFLCQFITPIVKVQKGKEERMFYSLAVYDEWRKENNNGKGWSIKYYKGLGTSTAAEAKSYFRKMDENKITFEYDDEADETIDLAFSAKRADDRKRWMAGTQATDVVDYRNKTLTYTDFANKDYVHYCKYSAERAIPSVVDGLKPTQRKILYGAFKKKMNKDLKVAQMVGYVSENGCYHHGETSLEGAIVAMAQSYVGSNNINLLVPSGQFGTRHLKGKDAASGRYLYTRLSPVTRKIFPEADDDVLEYKEDDGQTIEPTFFVPLIPMVLVNGASGIGTGYSTDVPSHSPIAIIDNIKQQLRGGRPRALKPHYERFLGEVTPIDKNGTFVIQGKIMKTSPTVLEIVDIPVGNGSDSTRTYKEMLERFVDPPKVVKDAKTGKSKAIEAPPEPVISDYREYHTEDTLHFKLKLTEEQMQRAEASGLQGLFKLNQTQSTANMMLHDAENVIRRYPSANEIIRDHMIVRLQLYEKRKKHLIAKLTEEKVILGERLRFTELMVDPDFRVLMVQGEAEIHAALAQHNFKPIRELRQLVASSIAEDKEVDLVAQQDFPGSQKYTRDDFRYLTSADIYGYTMEEVNRLREQSQAKAALLEEIKKKSVEQMWDDELSELREMLMDEKLENAEAVIDNAEEEGPDKSKTKKPKMAAKGKGKPDAPLQVETGADNISTKPQKSSAELVREKLQHEIEYFSQQEVNKEVPVTKIVLDDLIVQQNDDKKKQPGHRPSSKKRPQAGKNIKKNAKEMIPAAGAKKNEKLLPDSDEEEPEQKRRRVIGTGKRGAGAGKIKKGGAAGTGKIEKQVIGTGKMKKRGAAVGIVGEQKLATEYEFEKEQNLLAIKVAKQYSQPDIGDQAGTAGPQKQLSAAEMQILLQNASKNDFDKELMYAPRDDPVEGPFYIIHSSSAADADDNKADAEDVEDEIACFPEGLAQRQANKLNEMHSNRLDLFKKLVQNVGWDKDTANIFPPGTTVAASGQLNEGLRLLVYKELEKMKEDIDKTHAEYAVAKNDKGDVLRVVNALDFVDKKSVVLESFAMWQAQCLVQLFKQDEVAKKAGGDQATKFMNDVAQLEQVVQEMTRNFEKPQEKMQQLQLLRDEVTAGIQTFLCNDPKMVTTIAERRPLLHHSPHVIVANLVTPHSGDVMSGKKTTEFRKTLGELAKDFPSEGDPSVPDLTLLQRLPLLFRGNKSVIAVAAIKQVKILKTASECEEAARSGYSDPDYGSKTVLQYLGAKDYQSAMKKPIYAIEFENTVVLRKPVPMERTGNAFQNVLCVKHRPGWAEAAIEEATRVAWSDGKDAEEDAKLSEEDASDGDEDQDARLSDGNEHEHESDEEEFWDDGVVPMEIC